MVRAWIDAIGREGTQSVGQEIESLDYFADETYQVTDLSAVPEGEGSRGRVSWITVFLLAFIVLVVLVGGVWPWHYVVKGMGVVLAVAYAVRSLREQLRPSPEMILFAVWVLWGTAGLLVAVSSTLVRIKLVTLVQVWILLAAVSGLTSSRRQLSANMFGLLISVAALAVMAIVVSDFMLDTAADLTDERLSWGRNPNGFGRLMVLGTIALAYFWSVSKPQAKIRRMVLIPGFMLLGVSCLRSGSRFSVLGLALTYVSWLWFSYRREVRQRPSILLWAVIGLLAAGAFFFFAGRGTAGAHRLESTWLELTGQRARGGGFSRLEIYKTSGRVFLENMAFGVGFDNYRIHSPRGKVTHSEYMEVACSTGLPGAIIYFSIYGFLWVRAGRAAKYAPEERDRRVAGLIRAALLVMLFLGLGAPWFMGKVSWVVLGSFIGYTRDQWRRIKESRGDLTQWEEIPLSEVPAY